MSATTRIIGMILIVAAILAIFTCGMADEIEYTVLVPQGETLTVRSAPNLGSMKLGRLDLGDTFVGSEIHSGWVKVGPPTSMEMGEAYIKADYLTTDEVKLLEKPVKYRTTAKVHARTKPGGKKIKTLKRGKEISVIATLPDCVYTQEGWCISREFVEEVP